MRRECFIGRMLMVTLLCMISLLSLWGQLHHAEASRLLHQGDSLVRRFRTFEALKCYERALRYERAPILLRKLSQLYYDRGQYPKSLNVLSMMPADSLCQADLRLRFQIYRRRVEIDSVKYIGHQILHKYPYDAEIVGLLSSVYNQDEKPDSALAIVDAYMSLDTTNLYVNEQQAYAYYLKQEYGKAAKLYASLIQKDNRNSSFLYYGGLSWARLDEKRSILEGLKYLKLANELERYKNPYILSQLGMLSVEVYYDTDAVQYIQKALEVLYPDNNLLYNLYNSLATAQFRTRQYQASIDALRKCIELRPKFIYNYYKIAQCYGVLGQAVSEMKYYKTFLKLMDETSNPSPAMQRMIDDAKSRIKTLREENFFKNGIPKNN